MQKKRKAIKVELVVMVTELHCIDNVRMSVSAISQSVSLCQCKDSSISSAVQKLFISALDENTLVENKQLCLHHT